MAAIGRTLLRLTGAVLLGASAASIDNPGLLYAPTTGERTAQPSAVEEVVSGPEIRITPGKRAFAFRVDDAANWIDLLQPNSRVDILVVTDVPEHQRPVAKLLMENMRLLAIRAVPERLLKKLLAANSELRLYANKAPLKFLPPRGVTSLICAEP